MTGLFCLSAVRNSCSERDSRSGLRTSRDANWRGDDGTRRERGVAAAGRKYFVPGARKVDPSCNHSAAAAIALIANFAPELSGILTALFPPLLEVLAKLFDFVWLALRFATFGELAGSRKRRAVFRSMPSMRLMAFVSRPPYIAASPRCSVRPDVGGVACSTDLLYFVRVAPEFGSGGITRAGSLTDGSVRICSKARSAAVVRFESR